MKSINQATLVKPLIPDWDPVITAVIPEGCQLIALSCQGAKTATYVLEVIRYEQDPWDEQPTVVDDAFVTLEAPMSLLESEPALKQWVKGALPGWTYLTSYNAASVMLAFDPDEALPF